MGPMLLAIAVVACSGGNGQSEPVAEGSASDAAGEVVEAPAAEPKDGFANSTTYLRKFPTTDKRIDDPDNPGKRIGTYVATVYRGNALSVVETQEEFVRVLLEDGSGNEGWLQSKRVTTADAAKLATIKEEVRTFSRPDLLSINTSDESKLKPGSVLIVLQEQGKFFEVDYPRSQWSSDETYVLAENLVMNEDDIAAAQLITKALYMRDDDPEKAKPIIELAREQFAGNSLLTLLDPPEAEVVPVEGGEEGQLVPPPE